MSHVAYCLNDNHVAHARPGHPERPGRLTAIRQHAEHHGWLDGLVRSRCEPAALAAVTRVHSAAHMERVRRAVASGQHLDPDTYTVSSAGAQPDTRPSSPTDADNGSTPKARKGVDDEGATAGPETPDSLTVALSAAGGLLALSEGIVAGDWVRGFALIRPPGHHAEPNRAMGFCLVNHAAIAARHAVEALGVERVSILDWDVHHGNGTQAATEADPNIQYISLHQHPLYPGTGWYTERGTEGGRGTVLNIPLPPMAGGTAYRTAFDELVEPAVRRFDPGLILVSAGFDAHWRDPLANMSLSVTDFGALTRQTTQLADELCGGRLLLTLEGGYDTEALAASVAACMTVLRDPGAEVADPLGPSPGQAGGAKDRLAEIRAAVRPETDEGA